MTIPSSLAWLTAGAGDQVGDLPDIEHGKVIDEIPV